MFAVQDAIRKVATVKFVWATRKASLAKSSDGRRVKMLASFMFFEGRETAKVRGY